MVYLEGEGGSVALEVGYDLLGGGGQGGGTIGLETQALHDLLKMRHLRQQTHLLVLETHTAWFVYIVMDRSTIS